MSLDKTEDLNTSWRSWVDRPWLRSVRKAKREREHAVIVERTCSTNWSLSSTSTPRISRLETLFIPGLGGGLGDRGLLKTISDVLVGFNLRLQDDAQV